MTHSSLRLSICIPTHQGRAAVLKKAIDSVLVQLTPSMRTQVQICISDNASEDETQKVVERCIQKYPGVFIYHRHPKNLGFTRNLLALVSLAQGEYCWLLSSDDALAENGLSRVLAALAGNPGLAGLTMDLRYYDRSLTHCIREDMPAVLLPRRPKQAQVYTSPSQIFRECGLVQGGFSMQVFDRKLWLEALNDAGETKCASFQFFPYLYLFGRMVKKRPSWLWLPEKLVWSRTDNDYLSQEMSLNALRYQTGVMNELFCIWKDLFGADSATCQSLMKRNGRLFWSAAALLSYKSCYTCTAADEARALGIWTRCLFFLPAFWLTAFPVLLTPRFVVHPAVSALRRTGCIPMLRGWNRRFVQVRMSWKKPLGKEQEMKRG